MWKWTKRAFIVAVIGYGGYGIYDFYRAGLHTRPKMPDGAFSMSYKNGLRAILVDVPDERVARRYFGTPLEVPFYLKDAWSFCYPPTDGEIKHAAAFIKERAWPGERFEAICRIQVESETVDRGLVTSVPKL